LTAGQGSTQTSSPSVQKLIDPQNKVSLSIGDNTWIQPGTKNTIFDEVPIGVEVTVAVVTADFQTHVYTPILAFAGFTSRHRQEAEKWVRVISLRTTRLPEENPAALTTALTHVPGWRTKYGRGDHAAPHTLST